MNMEKDVLDWMSNATDKIEALEFENAKLREALEAVEWVKHKDKWHNVYSACAWCGSSEIDGKHGVVCKRQLALKGGE